MENQIKPLLPYNPNIDEKTAMEEAMKIWAWLKDTGLSKENHPDYSSTLEGYCCGCPLCESFRLNNKACYCCPLFGKEEPCYCGKNLYKKWCDSLTDGGLASKQTATAIYNKIAQAYKDRFGVEYNPYVTPESVSE